MKKLIIAMLIIITTGIVLSSCSSRGPRCEAMYSKVQSQEVKKPM